MGMVNGILEVYGEISYVSVQMRRSRICDLNGSS
jgi:hypothetical protein